MFESPGAAWRTHDKTLISEGWRDVSRVNAKEFTLSPGGAGTAIGLEERESDAAEMMSAI